MGLLNFLSKKSESDLRGRDSLKTSAYDATVALAPPIRGKYPVRGNGSKILEQYQKSHPDLAAISRNHASGLAQSRSNGLHSPGVERPSTAPSSQLRESTFSSLQSQAMPELPSPPKKKYGPYKLPSKVVTDVQSPSIPSKPAPSPGLVSMYSVSTRSAESSKPKGYVDLLDAQSRFKPSDFYGRIQATGVKNYGEDVADRNRETKDTSLHTQSQEPTQRQVDAQWNAVISKDVDDDSDDERPSRPRIRHSVSSGLRSKHNSSYTPGSFPKRTSSRLPQHGTDDAPKAMTRSESARSERAARRKSMPSFSATASSEVPRSLSTVKGGKEADMDLFPDALRDRVRAATTHDREHTKPNISTKRQSLVSSHAGEQPRQKRNNLDKPLPALPTSPKEQSKRRTQSHHSVVMDSRLLAKRQSIRSIRSRSRGEVYDDTYQQKISLQGSQSPREQNSARRQLGSTTDLQEFLYDAPVQQSDYKSQIISSSPEYSDSKRGSPSSNPIREQSVLSLSYTGLDVREIDIETFIPERGSSLRHWSLTSETAMSTMSSDVFRPQSGHTTTTSVEFSPMFPLAYPDRSIPPVPSIPLLKTPHSMSRKSSTIPSLPRSHITQPKHQSHEFYLEDYASADGSSTTSPSRGSYEKDLLFSESGYGVSGTQISGLPGLFDAALPTTSSNLTANQRLEDEVYGVSGLSRMPAHPNFSSDDSFGNREWTDSDDEMNFDIPMSRAKSTLRDPQPQERILAKRRYIEKDDSDY